MLKTELETDAVRGFTRAFGKGHRDSINRAGKSVAFWMKQELAKDLRSSAGVDPVAPLTKRTRPGTRNQALVLIAKAVAFSVGRIGRGGLQILVGPDLPGRRSISRYLLENVFGGKRWTMTRPQQRALGERIQARGANLKRGPQLTAGRGKKKHSVIPRLGRRMELPARPVVALFAARILPKARANLARLYATAQRGERWARDWYKDEA